MTAKSRVYGLMGLIFTIIGFLCKSYYRDYINSNGINDFGIAGFLPSYLYVVGFSLLLLIRPAISHKLVIAIVTMASILYEIKQYISSENIDFKDIYASVAGGFTALIIIVLIDRKYSVSTKFVARKTPKISLSRK